MPNGPLTMRTPCDGYCNTGPEAPCHAHHSLLDLVDRQAALTLTLSHPLLLCVQSGFHEFLARCDFIDTTTFARNTGAKDSRHKVRVGWIVVASRIQDLSRRCTCLSTLHSWRRSQAHPSAKLWYQILTDKTIIHAGVVVAPLGSCSFLPDRGHDVQS